MPQRTRAWRIIFAIAIIALGVYLIGNGRASLIDRDEPRYAQTSRQMLQSGDWIVPRLYDEPRTAKPVGIYWLQAGAMKVMGDTAFAARFPSALAMPITLLLVGAAVMRWAGPRRAVWTVFILATSILVIVTAKVCLTDSVLLVWITIAQGCLYLIWRGRGTWPVIILMGIAIGIAGLVKGPVVLGMLGMTALALWGLRGLDAYVERKRTHSLSPVFRGEGRGEGQGAERMKDEGGRMNVGAVSSFILPPSSFESRPSPLPSSLNTGERGTGHWFSAGLKSVVVILIVAAIVGPWLWQVHVRAPSFVGKSLSHDVLSRISSGLEGHSAPPGYHLVTIWGTYLPWSILLPMAIVFAFKRRHLPQIRFSLAAVIGPWIMLEIVRTKLPHYMLPVFPFLAFLTADVVVRCLRGQQDDLVRPQFIGAFRIVAGVIVIAAALPWWLLLHFHSPAWPGIVVFFMAIVVMYSAVSLFTMRKPAKAMVSLGLGTYVLVILFWTVYLTHADPLRLSIRVADVLKAHGVVHPHEVVMLDYKEPSLAFYQGGTIRENPALALSDKLLDDAPPWLVITREVWNNPKTTASARERLTIIDTLRGLAYADGARTVDVMIVRQK